MLPSLKANVYMYEVLACSLFNAKNREQPQALEGGSNNTRQFTHAEQLSEDAMVAQQLGCLPVSPAVVNDILH